MALTAKDFGLYQRAKEDVLPESTPQELAYKLMKRPPKEKKVNAPIMNPDIKPWTIQQADLLFLPSKKKTDYKYALVVVDVATRQMDAEPLRSKAASAVAGAFKKIYERGIIKKPRLLQTDSGTEFKSKTKDYLTHIGVDIRYGRPGRHRQQAVVEAFNGVLVRGIFHVLHAKELETGRPSFKWAHLLPDLVRILNEKNKNYYEKLQKKKKNMPLERGKGKTLELIPEGTKVRVKADFPIDSHEGARPLKGKFRQSDLRWDPQVRTIVGISIIPYQPPLYSVSGIEKVLYSREQLQLV